MITMENVCKSYKVAKRNIGFGEAWKALFHSLHGDVVYELCLPVSIYNMWFSRSVANRSNLIARTDGYCSIFICCGGLEFGIISPVVHK